MRQNEIPDRIRALNRILVAIESLEEPGIFLCNELARLLIGPQLFGEMSVRLSSGETRMRQHIQCIRNQGAGQCSSAALPSTPPE